MKKIFSIVVLMIVLTMSSISAFAANGNCCVLIPEEPSQQETFDPLISEEFAQKEAFDTLIPEWIEKKEEKYSCLKDYYMKANTLYVVTRSNKLMLVNLKTNQLYFIADNVAGLFRFGMNGRYIGYVTLKDETFTIPYEVGEDGNLSTDFQLEFGE